MAFSFGVFGVFFVFSRQKTLWLNIYSMGIRPDPIKQRADPQTRSANDRWYSQTSIINPGTPTQNKMVFGKNYIGSQTHTFICTCPCMSAQNLQENPRNLRVFGFPSHRNTMDLWASRPSPFPQRIAWSRGDKMGFDGDAANKSNVLRREENLC